MRVPALTMEINFARIAPAQLVVFIEEQTKESKTPATSEETNCWPDRARACTSCVRLWLGVEAFY